MSAALSGPEGTETAVANAETMADRQSRQSGLADNLRQMIAVLQEERQALAGMDLDGLLMCSSGKQDLCDSLQARAHESIDAECRGLLLSAKELNEVNRRVRNLLATNVAARLDALTGSGGTYTARQSSRRLSLQGA